MLRQLFIPVSLYRWDILAKESQKIWPLSLQAFKNKNYTHWGRHSNLLRDTENYLEDTNKSYANKIT